MTNEYGYDPIKLIRAVKMHPNLWDRGCLEYKTRSNKQDSWEKIFREVVADFDDLSARDRQTIGVTLQSKWNNIRDAFIRSVKKAATALEPGDKKKYVYSNELLFLLKHLNITPEEFMKFYADEDSFPTPIALSKIKRENPDDLLVLRKKFRLNEETTEVYIEPYIEEETNVKVESKRDSEDELFFSSILPTISKYTEDEKLEFRMDVLSAMKKIRDKRL